MRHKCPLSSRVSLVHSFFAILRLFLRLRLELPGYGRTHQSQTPFLRPRPSIVPLRKPESDFAHTPPSLRTLRADVCLWRRCRPRADSRRGRSHWPLSGLWNPSLRTFPSTPLPTVLAAATHVGVRAPAVAAAAAFAAASRNRRLTLSGRNHELGRQQLCEMLPLRRGASAPVPAAVHGAGSRSAAQQRAAPAGGGGGGGTRTAGSLWRPGRGAATAAPASRSLFPRGCAGNLGPAWAPVPSSCACVRISESLSS